MKAPAITIDRKLKKVTIEMALETARPSKATGRTMLIASTRGLRTSPELSELERQLKALEQEFKRAGDKSGD